MTKTFDEMMKVLEEKGAISEEDGKKLIEAHGPLTDDEKKDLAAAIKMKRALSKPAAGVAEGEKQDDKPDSKPAEGEKQDEKPAAAPAAPAEEVSMDDYLQALSVLDSEAATKEDKEKAEKIKAKFESQ